MNHHLALRVELASSFRGSEFRRTRVSTDTMLPEFPSRIRAADIKTRESESGLTLSFAVLRRIA